MEVIAIGVIIATNQRGRDHTEFDIECGFYTETETSKELVVESKLELMKQFERSFPDLVIDAVKLTNITTWKNAAKTGM